MSHNLSASAFRALIINNAMGLCRCLRHAYTNYIVSTVLHILLFRYSCMPSLEHLDEEMRDGNLLRGVQQYWH